MIGRQLGHFRLLDLIGEGGMGVVYRAVDVDLQRQVALKVLPAASAGDGDRRERFLREARAASALNHPAIVTIHEVGREGDVDFIAMELVEGRTLQSIIPAGGLGVAQAVEYGLQIAEALAAAHDKGVVHRDLKPSNVVVTASDRVKVLDFGLAKLLRSRRGVGAGEAPTEAATVEGAILGTPAYMSPEQAQGHPVDHRSDLFSFGCVLHHILAGVPPFSGPTPVGILTAVLRDQPPALDALRPDVPADLARIVAKALEKDLELRYQGAAELIADLRRMRRDHLSGSLSSSARAALSVERPSVRPWRSRLTVIGTALVAISVVILGARLWRGRAATTAAPLRFELLSTFPGAHRQPSLSPDGGYVAFVNEDAAGIPQIWVKSIAAGEPVQITHSEIGALRPRWSPRNDQIVFDVPGNGLYTVPPLGGTPRKLVDIGFGAAFSPDGERLVFESGDRLWTARADGSAAAQLGPDDGPAAIRKQFVSLEATPAFSPDGQEVVYFQDTYDPHHGDLWAVSLADPGRRRQLTHDGVRAQDPVWLPDGSLVFASTRSGAMNLWRLPPGASEPVALTTGTGEDADVDVSRDGRRLVYTNSRNATRLVVLDPRSGARRVLGERRVALDYTHPAFAPDGERLVYFAREAGANHLYTVARTGGVPDQLTFGKDDDSVLPEWSADGRHVYFYKSRPPFGYHRLTLADGKVVDLLPGFTFPRQHGVHVDPRGERAVYLLRDPGARRTLVRDLASGGEHALATAISWPRWSPDGQWVVGSAQDGPDKSALLICPPDGAACRRLVANGREPRWAADGSEVYFVRHAGPVDDRVGGALPVLAVRPDGTGEREVARLTGFHRLHFFYDVSRRGELVWCEFEAGRQELWMTELSDPGGGVESSR